MRSLVEIYMAWEFEESIHQTPPEDSVSVTVGISLNQQKWPLNTQIPLSSSMVEFGSVGIPWNRMLEVRVAEGVDGMG